jgi:hypothetical protein
MDTHTVDFIAQSEVFRIDSLATGGLGAQKITHLLELLLL